MTGLKYSLTIIAPLLLLGCNSDESYQDIPPPWWILNVYVVEDSGDTPPPAVVGCPRVRWRIFPQEDYHDDPCTIQNRVKIWGHIEETMTIEFQVKCDGYHDSELYTAFMNHDEIRTLPGRKGPEVEQNRTVFLFRR
jgi:hypothetical protein